MTEQTLMGKKDFAAHIKRSPSYVTSLLKAGRLVMEGRGVHAKVRVAESLALIENTQGARDDVAARHALERTGEGVGQPPAPGGAPTGLQDTPVAELRERRAAAELRRTLALAEQEELNAAKLRGDLVAREDADAAMKFVGATIRGMLDVLPDQLAPIVAPVTDLNEVHGLLAEASRNVLEQLGAAIARQKDELGKGAGA